MRAEWKWVCTWKLLHFSAIYTRQSCKIGKNCLNSGLLSHSLPGSSRQLLSSSVWFQAFRPQGLQRISGYVGSLGNRKNLAASENPHIIHILFTTWMDLAWSQGLDMAGPPSTFPFCSCSLNVLKVCPLILSETSFWFFLVLINIFL